MVKSKAKKDIVEKPSVLGLNRNTMWSMSLATMATFVGAIWMASIFVQDKIGLIDKAIAAGESNKVKWVQHDIESLKDERLSLRSYLRKNPTDDDAQDDLDEVEDNLDDLKDTLQCMREGKDNCE